MVEWQMYSTKYLWDVETGHQFKPSHALIHYWANVIDNLFTNSILHHQIKLQISLRMEFVHNPVFACIIFSGGEKVFKPYCRKQLVLKTTNDKKPFNQINNNSLRKIIAVDDYLVSHSFPYYLVSQNSYLII